MSDDCKSRIEEIEYEAQCGMRVSSLTTHRSLNATLSRTAGKIR